MRIDELNLFELTGVKHMYEKDLDDIIKALKDKGTNVLGRGSFALALKHSSKSEVIKFWIKDSSYDDFIEYVQKNPSPHFPKLHSKPKELSAFFLRPVDFPEKIKYVRMEELTKIPEDLSDAWVEVMLKSPRYDSMDEAVEGWLEILDKEKDESHLKDQARVIKLFGTTKAELEGFWKFAERFYKTLIVNKGHSFDIHDENIMMRGNTLVFTDPIYNRAEHDISRIIRAELGELEYLKSDPDRLKEYPHKTGRSKKSNSKDKNNA
jgi:hypothetical protein